MGQTLKSWWEVLKSRWTNAMPKFFKWVFRIFAFIGGLALAVNEGMVVAGAQPHEWWIDIYPYLIGTSAGAAFVAKMTQKYDEQGKPISGKKKEKENTVLDHDNF